MNKPYKTVQDVLVHEPVVNKAFMEGVTLEEVIVRLANELKRTRENFQSKAANPDDQSFIFPAYPVALLQKRP